MSGEVIQTFQTLVWEHYAVAGRRDLPWRQLTKGRIDPYHVLVSELMLQQTQVPRVIPKFVQFLALFPTVHDLAAASLADVLRAWNGLGYNRRAKFLWQAAGQIVAEHNALVPAEQAALVKLPGVGPNTAGAILAYAHNQQVAFIETNIRSVYIHHFFPGKEKVADAEIVPLVAATVPTGQPREWYWALMDYGTALKQQVGNTARASKAYTKQSIFHGSRRKIRGQVIRLLTESDAEPAALMVSINDDRLPAVLEDLEKEGLIAREGLRYRLAA